MCAIGKDTMVCPIMNILTILGRKWNLCILHTLDHQGNFGFNALAKELDVTPRILSKRLKELEDEKIISKKIISDIPHRVEYSLTKKGHELIECFSTIDDWVTKYQ